MEDCNAKIGADNRGYEEIMEQRGFGEMNANGERFPDLCGVSNLIIRGSVFQQKEYTRQLGYHLTSQQRTR